MHSESKKWIDLGICSMRMNQHEGDADGKKRLLIKSQDSTSKIMCNCLFFAHMKPELVEKTNSVIFLGVNLEGKPVKYLIRVKTPQQAKEVYDKFLQSIPT